jgi:hypothetical protein
MTAPVIQELSALLDQCERADGLHALPAAIDSATVVRLVKLGRRLAGMPLVRNSPSKLRTGPISHGEGDPKLIRASLAGLRGHVCRKWLSPNQLGQRALSAVSRRN